MSTTPQTTPAAIPATQTLAQPIDRYIVGSSRAKMPSSCMGGGHYYRIAVIEMRPGATRGPAMISDRAVGVAQIIETWERLYRGTTGACAYARAWAEAEAMAARLNAAIAS